MFRKSTQQEIEEEETQFDDADVALNAPLDVRYVVVGLLMMVLSLPIAIFIVENQTVRFLCFGAFVASIFIMTKRKKL